MFVVACLVTSSMLTGEAMSSSYLLFLNSYLFTMSLLLNVFAHYLAEPIYIQEGPCVGNCSVVMMILYIFTTLEFPTLNSDFHLLTTSVNAKYYYIYIYIYMQVFLPVRVLTTYICNHCNKNISPISAKLPLLYISGTLSRHQLITLQHPLFISTLQNLPLCYISTLQNLPLCT